MADLNVLREEFLKSKKLKEMYVFLNFNDSKNSNSLTKSYDTVEEEYKKAHAKYFYALVAEASSLVSKNVRDSEAFYYQDHYICVNYGTRKFKQYFPPPGRGNGIYDGINWEDFEMLLSEDDYALFCNRGISIFEVDINIHGRYTDVVEQLVCRAEDIHHSDLKKGILFFSNLLHSPKY